MARKMSTTEAAKRLGVSPALLREWANNDKGPPYFKPHESAHRRYDEEQLEKWVQENTHYPERDTA